MDRRKILLILGAAWLSAALLTWFLYAATVAPHAEKTVAITAAARDMPAGTLLKKGDLTTIAIREQDVPRTAIRDAKVALNHPLLFPVTANEFITTGKLGGAGAEGLAATIEIGKRAVTVPITDGSGVAGLIPPRAHVDVMFTRPGSLGEALTTTILEDVIVLAIGRVTEVVPTTSTTQTSSSTSATATRPTTTSATLLVTPEQVRKIELAKNLGKISLSLRNPLDDVGTTEETATTTTSEDLGLFPPTPPVRNVIAPRIETRIERPPPAPAAPKPPPKTKMVEVFRGNQHSQEAFK